ncbi:MAG: ferrochelatase [Ignavibacteriales bacterium CG_4_9_14_3_um_filter_30_11]|nr:MAG: ferrochelatase [Ignavibacteriales bacterium CG_4_9_14_3_um_filter_30_11]
MAKTAVVLLNLGGPDSLEAVQPFLENLFNDPDIFKLPFQKSLARYISKKRAPKVEKQYKKIGGKSPLGMWTEKQRQMLEIKLREINSETDVYIAMRYWKPLTGETSKEIEKNNYSKIILLPLYPHYSISTTGSSFNEWRRCYKGNVNTVFIDSYFDNTLYIKAINEKIDKSLLKFPEEKRKKVYLVFSAHGTPVSYVKKGDPYSRHIKKTISAVMKSRKEEYSLCYQSKVGPTKWLEPSSPDKIKELASQGNEYLLIIPISFVSDHIETEFELGIEYKRIALESGIKSYVVMEGLNDSQTFINALFEIAKPFLNE